MLVINFINILIIIFIERNHEMGRTRGLYFIHSNF